MAHFVKIHTVCAAIGLCLLFSETEALAEPGEQFLLQSTRVKAFVAPNETCGSQMKFILRAALPEVFSEQSREVAEIVGGLRIIAIAQCPRLEKAVLVGYVGDELVFAGSASKSDNWRLVTLSAPSTK